jgi:DNA modification methylase
VTPYYADDLVTIYHGDCREWMPEADVIVTDPPYGIATKWVGGSRGHGWDAAGRKRSARNAWDQGPGDISCILEMRCPTVIWGGNYFTVPPARGWLVWRKETTGFSLADAELAWTNLDQPVRVFTLPRNKGPAPEHPTTKPLSLMIWTISFCPPGTILDPYMGSGSTLVAAKSLGRRAIGIEIEERYCEIAASRCSQEVLGLGA